MTVRELLRTPKMQDAIGGAIGVLLALAAGTYFGLPTPAHTEQCVDVPYDVGERPQCVRWQP